MEVLLEDCGAEVGKLWKICITHRYTLATYHYSLERICSVCQHRTDVDEKHLVFECHVLQYSHHKCRHLIKGT